MVARLRLLSALCALVAAVIVVWQTNPAGQAAGRRVRHPDDQRHHHHQVAGHRDDRPGSVQPLPGHPARRGPAARAGLHPADTRGRAALQVRRRELSDGDRSIRLAHVRGDAARRRGRTRYRRSPRRAVLDHEADRLEQPLVDHLCGGVRHQLRGDSADHFLLADRVGARPRLHADQPAASARLSRRTTSTEAGPSESNARASRLSPRRSTDSARLLAATRGMSSWPAVRPSPGGRHWDR